jgi:starvation-inducible outer membrane lipoprotein
MKSLILAMLFLSGCASAPKQNEVVYVPKTMAELEQIMREHDQYMQSYRIERAINKSTFNNQVFQSQILNAIKNR